MTSTVLWALHVRGPDDVVAMPDYDTAVAFADWFTAIDRANAPDEDCPLFAAVPLVWPWSAEKHAADLARREATAPNMRDYPTDVPRADSIADLTVIARRHPLGRFGELVQRRKTAERAS